MEQDKFNKVLEQFKEINNDYNKKIKEYNLKDLEYKEIIKKINK